MEQNIYDDEEFFKGYSELREGVSANDLIEIPQFFDLIGDVKDKTILVSSIIINFSILSLSNVTFIVLFILKSFPCNTW